MTTQNRYYSNLAQGSTIINTGGISDSTNAVAVQATVNWPLSFPFAVRFEPGTANEEVGLVTSGAGTSSSPYMITRGYDGTNPLSHSQGTNIIPGFAQIDLAEPQWHINLNTPTSGAHGLPSNAWGGGTVQLLQANAAPVSGSLLFNSIPTTYNHLRIVYVLLGNGTGGSIQNGVDVVNLKVNNLSVSSNWVGMYSQLGSSSVTTLTGTTSGGAPAAGLLWNTNYSTRLGGTGYIDIPYYASSAAVKHFHCHSYATDGGSTASALDIKGSWQTSAMISAIAIGPSGASSAFLSGEAWLYGIT
jgi:hypothetical protein